MKVDAEIMEQSLLPRLSRSRLFRLAGLTSVLGAIGAVAADIILQYDPQGHYGTMLSLHIAPWRVYAGHFLGIASIPIEIVGYWLVCHLLLPYAPRLARVMFWVMSYAVVIGAVFHGTFLPLIFSEQAVAAVPGSSYPLVSMLQGGIIPLSLFFLLCYLAMWGIFIVIVLRKPSAALPRWIAALAPALGSTVITLLYESRLLPVVGNVLYPTVLSFPHLVFFSALTMLVWRETAE